MHRRFKYWLLAGAIAALSLLLWLAVWCLWIRPLVLLWLTVWYLWVHPLSLLLLLTIWCLWCNSVRTIIWRHRTNGIRLL